MKDYYSLLVVAAIYFVMYVFNYLMPLCYGDDYLYSFVWTGDQGFFEPLPESARRLSSWGDVVDSLYNHYFTHAGRTMIFLPIFFFLWQGKEFFNFFCAGLFVLLVLEIYWLANKGTISLKFKASRVCFIFVVLWTFTIGFPIVFCWVTGACNYLWAAVLLLGFLLPYVRKYFGLELPQSKMFVVLMFVFGVIAGWTNENTVCWFVVVLAAQIYFQRRSGEAIASWQVVGLIGLTIGYAFLMFAPGNFVRLAEDSTMIPTDWWVQFKSKAITFLVVMLFQFLLWYYFLKTLRTADDFGADDEVRRSVTLAKIFALVSLASNLIMFLAPEFPMRSSFPSLIYLLIAVTILVGLQNETGRNMMKAGARYFLHAVGTIYFIMTLSFSLYGNYELFKHAESINRLAEQSSSDAVLEVENFTIPNWLYFASGIHLANIPLSKDAGSWENVAYARYYKIKAIRAK